MDTLQKHILFPTLNKYALADIDFPEQLYENIMDMAESVTKKMRTFGEGLQGKLDPVNLSIQSQNFKVINSLRLNNPSKYKNLVHFATVYPGLSYDDKKKQLETYFTNF